MDRAAIDHTAHVLGLAELTGQEVTFVQSLLRGLPLAMAAEQVGVPIASAQTFLTRPQVAAVLAYLRETQITTELRIDRNMLNLMLMEAHAKSATATEEIMAVRELAKINGLNAPQQIEVTRRQEAVTASQLRRMSSEDLAALADEDLAIDGEYTEVTPDEQDSLHDV